MPAVAERTLPNGLRVLAVRRASVPVVELVGVPPSSLQILLLSEAQNPEYLTNYPWLLAPGVAIFITVLAFNFLGDGLRDAVDTKS